MRWKPEKKPKHGDIRVIKRFALFWPVELEDGYKAIFESYHVQQMYNATEAYGQIPQWNDITYYK